MLYRINPLQLPIILIFTFIISWNIFTDFVGTSTLPLVFFLLLAIGLALTRFSLKINNSHLIYQIKLFTKPLYRKVVSHEHIDQMKFIRVGWAKKGAIIKLKKGFAIRLKVLEPKSGYDDLLDFADKHAVNVVKTKDYLILEKMK